MKPKNIHFLIIITILSIISVLAWRSWSFYRKEALEATGDLPSCPDCNVILISLDTLRAKSLPCFGYDKNTAPFLCDFASKSYTFTNAYSQSTYTLDSHMSLFTSLYPTSHGVAVQYIHTLSPDVATFAEIMKKHQYHTYYFGNTIESDTQTMVSRGLGRGFDTIVFSADDPASWIQSLQEGKLSSNNKFFAVFHTYFLHAPYVPKPTTLGKINFKQDDNYNTWYDSCKQTYYSIQSIHPNIFPIRIRGAGYNYCEEITQFYLRQGMDGEWGGWGQNEELQARFTSGFSLATQGYDILQTAEKRQRLYEAKIVELDNFLDTFFSFLKQEKILDNTIVIIFGDHGEEFQEHGNFSHGEYLYNETTHVPLIMNVPQSPSKRIDKLAQLIDVLPTILPIIGITVPVQAQGINLSSDATNDYVFSEVAIDKKRAIRGKNWELIINYDREKGTKTRELYDLTADPGEAMNLVQKNTAKADELERILDDHVYRRKIYKPMSQDLPTNISEEERRKLLQTGYR